MAWKGPVKHEMPAVVEQMATAHPPNKSSKGLRPREDGRVQWIRECVRCRGSAVRTMFGIEDLQRKMNGFRALQEAPHFEHSLA
jgi:hypothetical protein